jgi:nickel-dependent lactate racemase
MQVQLPFGRTTLTVDVPDTADVLLPGDVAPLTDPGAAVRDALRRPIAGLPLRDRVAPEDDVVIVISDITRPVPNRLLLPPIIDELHAAGVPDERITILNGTGLHRANTPAELEEMLGRELPARYRIVQHVARDRSTLVEVGRVGGVPVEFARAYVDATFRIVTGFVEPHLFAGWSGGAKGVMPGVAGGATIMANHGAENLANPLARWCVTTGNPVFEQIQAAVALRPFEFLLNVTIDNERRLTGVFAGDMAPAHTAAIEHAEKQYITRVDKEYDVVVVTNDRDGRGLRGGCRQRRLHRRPEAGRIAGSAPRSDLQHRAPAARPVADPVPGDGAGEGAHLPALAAHGRAVPRRPPRTGA